MRNASSTDAAPQYPKRAAEVTKELRPAERRFGICYVGRKFVLTDFGAERTIRGMGTSHGVHGLRGVVVGGIERLDRHYREREDGVVVETVFHDGQALANRVEKADGVVVVTAVISHTAAQKVARITRQHGTPVVRVHGGGLSQVRRSIDELVHRLAGAA
jgi:Uncharacterized protein conserved in bacteria (DUF2325)